MYRGVRAARRPCWPHILVFASWFPREWIWWRCGEIWSSQLAGQVPVRDAGATGEGSSSDPASIPVRDTSILHTAAARLGVSASRRGILGENDTGGGGGREGLGKGCGGDGESRLRPYAAGPEPFSRLAAGGAATGRKRGFHDAGATGHRGRGAWFLGLRSTHLENRHVLLAGAPGRANRMTAVQSRREAAWRRMMERRGEERVVVGRSKKWLDIAGKAMSRNYRTCGLKNVCQRDDASGTRDV
ncbi:hypothetical protein DFH09DRAFT_193504 [Mycena vulgaris]|nr:hypothetical protein DFH09DRAFT_193504 [Mycena vulgaris]